MQSTVALPAGGFVERFVNRFGILALHALIWTLPIGLFAIVASRILFPGLSPSIYCLFEQPSVGQRLYFQTAVLTIGLLYVLAGGAAGMIRVPRNPVLAAAAAYGMFVTLSGLAALSTVLVLKESVFVWCCVLLAALLAHLKLTRAQCRRLLVSYIGIAGISAFYAILQYLGLEIRVGEIGYSQDIAEGRFRVLGLQGHPNYLTAFIGPALLLCPGLIVRSSSRRQRVTLGVLALILVLGIFVAGSRSAYLATLLVGGGMALALWRQRPAFRLTRRSAAGVALAACVIGLFVIPNPVLPHRYSFSQRLSDARPIQGRLYFYLVATRMIVDHPVIGIGYGQYGVRFWEYADALQSDPKNKVFNFILEDVGGIRADQTHNEYLQMAAETGLLGLAAFFFLLIVFYGRLRNDFRHPELADERLILAGIGAGVAYLLVDSLFSFPLRLAGSSLVFWLLLGIGSRYACEENVPAGPRHDMGLARETQAGKTARTDTQTKRKR
ncbi:MAG: O-antigen ligase family protein [Candidatus Sumerlaeia bacterium]|nr:O-antigen ligase family protein [Candidatus Sumerlaeia bacterium]